MSVTIKDVAKMAGVSISTVSRVINNSKPVSNDIRVRVTEIIEATNYVPNPIARSLVLKKSNFIGVIVPDISNYKIGEILNGIEEIGKMYDYDILLCNSYGELKDEIKYINLLINKQVAGILFVSWNLKQEAVDIITKSNIPSVYVSKNAKDFDVFSVGIDHERAGYDVGNYLISKKNEDIIFMSPDHTSQTINSLIIDGVRRAFKESGRVFEENKLKYIKADTISAYEFIMDYIKSGQELPDAFFATNDDMAAGVINALCDNNIDVPKTVSVVGYDNTRIANIIRPTLTTVEQPLYDIGAISIRILIKKVEGFEMKEKNITLPHKIIERQSSI
ncbi:LacI family DNA-binding transcriptional regulator [Proteocatella sphenisci]|uniref:LacI family DNA-binding transcriptional regulator n=1 Tax=Proteocatella sphenisci TaxID=181070 RepID=UPI0004B7295F|nr:LacI family DNA-binding transcriptional regulator [Proteocatella sphenisci]